MITVRSNALLKMNNFNKICLTIIAVALLAKVYVIVTSAIYQISQSNKHVTATPLINDTQ